MIQAEERKLKITMEESLTLKKLNMEKMKVETEEKIAIVNETGNDYKREVKLVL